MQPLDRAELLLPAPGRGQYDRALTREKRQAEQRERLLLAVGSAFVRGRPSVSGVIDLAGVGRNTFYEYFDDYDHALDALRTQGRARVDGAWRAALASAHTPLERIRAVCRAWCSALLASRDEAIALLCADARQVDLPLATPGRELALALRHARTESGASPNVDEDARIMAVSAAAEALALRFLAQPEPPRAGEQSGGDAVLPSQSEADLAALVSQVAERVLR